MARKYLISRVALAVALSTGMAATVAVPTASAAKKDSAPKIEFSKEFSQAAIELDKTLSEAKSNPAVTAASDKARAAKTDAERAAAAAEVDAALGGAKAKLAEIEAVTTTSGDKVKLGEMMRTYGVLTADPALQNKGLKLMIDSGALQPDSLPQIYYLTGISSYQMADYAGAAQYLKQAKDAGYSDQQGLLDRVLADAYKRTGNTDAALQVAQQEIEAARAAGTKPSEGALRAALQAAYDAKQTSTAVDLAAELGKDYPTPSSWGAAINVVRSLAQLPSNENLDLMRLMARTNSMADKRDYLEYIENVDPRRFPGEALKIIDRGIAAGKLTPGEVAEAKQMAGGRVTADKASLEGSSTSGSANSVTATGDAFLSYDMPAKAEEFYAAALTKPGVEKDRATLRLGIAQVDQGKYAEAQQTFAKVGGNRVPVAKLWSAYAASKGGSTAAASTTAPASPAAAQ
ncbi:hypothetical protein B2G71_18405 [Novosphingobium sp. PC22D]|uniref:hypothetical protein n=1 Tax=Novosphingobium sp. PC22D TaxID=1962403 RepID=UPI000BF0E0A4|nr:hypothetical protein [Novosphingobium sp. PC22D]PEQ11257.1 hypothetical protein B2G71_18405 [Novosphingobium sp. PC22D]